MTYMRLPTDEAVRVFWECHIEPDQTDALCEMLQDLSACIQTECDSYQYELHKDLDRRGRFILCQTWPDHGALERHWQTPHYKALAETAEPPLKQPMSLIAAITAVVLQSAIGGP